MCCIEFMLQVFDVKPTKTPTILDKFKVHLCQHMPRYHGRLQQSHLQTLFCKRDGSLRSSRW